MVRPLYRSAQGAKRGDAGHAGLWYDKFLDTWPHDQSWSLQSKDKQNPKHEWLKTLGGSVGDAGQLAEARLRLAWVVEAAGGVWGLFRAESRFVTGLGRSHPVENGFAFHPSLGVPYLPGSSLKGLVRAWARDYGVDKGGEKEVDEEAITRLFGAAGDEGSEGSILFFDAIPVAPVMLEVDILTPHSAAWTPEDPPGDWRSPRPVPFLVTAPGAYFFFGIAPRRGEGELGRVQGWLRDALRFEGAGAKTAVGYGRFAEVADETRKLAEALAREARERRRAEALSTPEGRLRREVEESNEAELAELIRRYVEKGELTAPAERAAFVAAVRELRPAWLSDWRSKKKADKATNVGPDKLKARAKLIDSEPGG